MAYLQSGATTGSVNFPEVAYQERAGKSRILHVHRNVPSAMGALSSLVAEHGLNIVAQHLQTRGPIGYVISDIEGEVGETVISLLRSHPVTIRCDLV